MKTNLTIKILSVLSAIFTLLFVSLAYYSYYTQKDNLTNAFIERAKATAISLRVPIEIDRGLTDEGKIFFNIQKSMLFDPEIKNIDFNIPREGKLLVSVSSNAGQVGREASPDNVAVFRKNLSSGIITTNSEQQELTIAVPIHSTSGDVVGTIQIVFTLDNVEKIIRYSIYRLLGVYFLLMIVFFSIIYQSVKRIVIFPLSRISRGLEAITQHNVNYRAESGRMDEIGNIDRALEKMANTITLAHEELGKRVAKQEIEIGEKAKELEDEKSAILNILEDVQIKEQKAEVLAGDLEKFRLAVENATNQIVIADAEGTVVYGNRAVEKITGYTPEEVIGKKAGALWKLPMPKEFYENLWDVIKNQKKAFTGEIQNRRKNGDIYTAQISISPVLNKNKEIVYFVAVEHDITKEKEVDRAKTEFVSLASHQLRTPLSSINWYTEMLLAGDAGAVNEKQHDFLMEIAIGNQRMVELVNALLNVSRLELGTFIIESEPTNVTEIIESVVDELKPEILHKKLVVNKKYSDTIPVEYTADRKLFRIIMQNLLSNAIKYTPEGGHVDVTAQTVSAGEDFGGRRVEEDSLAFSVSDSGIGIPDDQKNNIFSKMFRANNARETETEGTGLGLYIIKSIIAQSGGAVWFESHVDRGTTFYVTLLLSGMKKREGTRRLD